MQIIRKLLKFTKPSKKANVNFIAFTLEGLVNQMRQNFMNYVIEGALFLDTDIDKYFFNACKKNN